MRLRQLGLTTAMAAMLAMPAMAQTTQMTPQTPQTSIPGTLNGATAPNAATPRPSTPDTSARTGAVTPVNINTATAAELDKLPGIGKARASAIIKHRPYKTTHELTSRHVIPSKTYNRIKADIVATPG
ncbi:MAG TPA: helix-hairpin-helix domain-containing protein [Rhodopila sp.]|nr:helix-hairpin-helix domain-containing protein [Rhodopila sp.]